MRRRAFIAGLGGAAAWPLVARTQQPAKVARIGFLNLTPASAWADEMQAFRAGLRDLGYVEDKNIVIEFRDADTVDQLPELAAELVRLNVDVIVAPSSTMVEAAMRATKTIPIVFITHADPIGLGHIASLARPGGNVTGTSIVQADLAAKSLQILQEAVPHAKRIGVLWNPTTPSHTSVLKELGFAANSLGIALIMTPIATVADFDGAFSRMAVEHVDGFLVVGSPLTNLQRVSLANLELKHLLPGIFSNKANVQAGGLMSYSADFLYMYRHAAIYLDKILKGEKPGDLPVQQATKVELVLNLKTAKTLGLTFPLSLLSRADEVIE